MFLDTLGRFPTDIRTVEHGQNDPKRPLENPESLLIEGFLRNPARGQGPCSPETGQAIIHFWGLPEGGGMGLQSQHLQLGKELQLCMTEFVKFLEQQFGEEAAALKKAISLKGRHVLNRDSMNE